MSIFNLFGSKTSDLYSDTNSDGDEDEYMYRLEADDTYTPVSKSEYQEATKDDWTSGYYDDVPLDDEPKKGWFGLW